MKNANTAWALNSLIQLGNRRASPTIVTRGLASLVTLQALRHRPNFLISSSPNDNATPRRVLLLLPRRSGLVGIEISNRRLTYKHASGENYTLKSRLLSQYMDVRGFGAMGRVPGLMPQYPQLLLHTNHLIAYHLKSKTVFPAYVHSLRELSTLSSRVVRTLDPQQCVLCGRYFEWDNWREVILEPGWETFLAQEDAIEDVVCGRVNIDEIFSLVREVKCCL
ncbi:unnamed protein product [Phytomonas sp. Hart1]|nr:unnamed protein product [Phytomonas sp. Hart1]|eukprot:CCW69308.1 unnamed protein product [Phytomonas sp. isolate Hart1]